MYFLIEIEYTISTNTILIQILCGWSAFESRFMDEQIHRFFVGLLTDKDKVTDRPRNRLADMGWLRLAGSIK